MQQFLCGHIHFVKIQMSFVLMALNEIPNGMPAVKIYKFLSGSANVSHFFCRKSISQSRQLRLVSFTD